MKKIQLMKKLIILLLVSCYIMPDLPGQDCIGASMFSKEAYLYGRFEVAMQSAEGSGVVSSFFLFNLDAGCTWPDENNEIDIEMTGNSEDILFTTHYPGPWYNTDSYDAGFNPHDGMHDYAIEWEPGVVRWFVDGALVNVQDQEFVNGLIHPMRIIMNLWVSEYEDWVGPWDPSIMPVESYYDYVRFYEYTPGNGNAGTANNFTFEWEDDFLYLDSYLWEVEEYGEFEYNYCTFKSSSVEFSGGNLIFQLEEAELNMGTVPVTFFVDMNEQSLSPSDIIYVNGTFNYWCGDCAPMNEDNGIWSLTLELSPGKHEFIFTKNIWEETGNPPLGSECDYKPCDDFANYGFLVLDAAESLILDSYCWETCSECESTSIQEVINREKKLIGIFDVMGRRLSKHQAGQLLFYLYDDGSMIKQLNLRN